MHVCWGGGIERGLGPADSMLISRVCECIGVHTHSHTCARTGRTTAVSALSHKNLGK